MTRPTRASLGAALLLPIVLIIAACGGGGTTATPTPVAGADGQPTPAGGDGNAVPSLPAGAIPSFDLGALTGGIPGADSYRTSTSTNGVKSYETVVVTKPELSKAITTFDKDGTVDSRIVLIGKEAWQAQGADGDFTAIPEALAGSMLLAFDPTMLLAAYANLDWGHAANNLGTEDKNGVRAVHLKIDPTTIVGLAGQMPAGSSIDVWVAEAGYVVSWEMSGFKEGQDMAIQVTNVNDPANKVERPS